MRAVKSRDTGPEIAARRVIWPISRGYRLHRKDIPGNPDIAFIGRKRAVFVHGCFWHGHSCKRGARLPKTNRLYWAKKINRNRARDLKARRTLRRGGWRVLVLWECQLKDVRKIAKKVQEFLQ